MTNRKLTAIAFVAAMFGATCGYLSTGCAQAQADTAAAAYGAALDACIYDAGSKAQIDACRAAVDAAWLADAGIVVVVAEGGVR